MISEPSLPSRGAWIEMEEEEKHAKAKKSLPSRGAWIEIRLKPARRHRPTSLPSRGAWIEICMDLTLAKVEQVAPLTGSVD